MSRSQQQHYPHWDLPQTALSVATSFKRTPSTGTALMSGSAFNRQVPIETRSSWQRESCIYRSHYNASRRTSSSIPSSLSITNVTSHICVTKPNPTIKTTPPPPRPHASPNLPSSHLTQPPFPPLRCNTFLQHTSHPALPAPRIRSSRSCSARRAAASRASLIRCCASS